MRPEAPLLMETADLRHWKCSATSAISSSLALPSIGADLSRASQVPPSACSNALMRELGLTFTWMTVAVLCFNGVSGEVNRPKKTGHSRLGFATDTGCAKGIRVIVPRSHSSEDFR